MLLVNPMLQSMDDLGKVFHLVMQNSNSHPLALLFILLGSWWRPLLLLLRLGRHNLDLFRRSLDTISGHMVQDRLVHGTGDIFKFVGSHPRQRLVRLGWKEVDLLGHLDRLWCIWLAWLVL